MMLEHWEERFRRGPLPPVVLLFGEERMLVEEAYRLLRERLEREDATGMDVEVIEADAVTPRELVERACAYPLGASYRGIFVRRAEHLLNRSGDAVTALVTYVRQPQPTTVLVFLSETVPEPLRGLSRQLRNPKQQQKAERALQRAPGIWSILLREHPWVEFPKLYDREIPSWVAQRARRLGYELAPAALETLLAMVGRDLAGLANELDKLALLAQSSGIERVEAEHVLQWAGLSRTYTIFELQRAIGEGDRESALRIAQYLVRSQRQELLIVATLTRYFLLLWKLADFEQMPAASPESIAAALGVHPFFLADYQAAYRRFGAAAVERALFALQEAEVALKTGAAPAESVIGMLLIRLLDLVSQPSRQQYAL